MKYNIQKNVWADAYFLKIYINNKKCIIITMMQAFGRADANIAVYAENAIVNAFGAVEYSCSQIQHQEELVRSCYQSLTE